MQGVWTVEEPVCTTPTQGVFTVEETGTVAIVGYADWVEDEGETYASVYNNEVTFSIKVVNATITEDPGDPGEPVPVSEIIGIITAAARPATMAVLNSSNSAMPDDASIIIDNSGRITYYGMVTAATATNVTIELNNITYNI